ncbi:Gfo/Idh/MocA family oxidoreductase [Streptomyces bathyalis]|uniref:Gfo/Idh/MocA family oxidoreductase n=1 Tax=Streptomyces bathyalis TaxID=2710756 RepID=A0A7T1WR02_9ACTN|nr:Gfo/Idh/MocA family oxidoreductase [Streptomyces bathyalis]QPP07493.1 Gfo/Idh/MocA family oxidoreductase [Streptomyces bathyalis]
MTSGDLRIGVVGVGERAVLASHAHHPGAGARVVACADPHPRGQEAARTLFGPEVPVHQGHEEMLAAGGLDAVMVLSPDHLHARCVLDALRAGVAVFVEKPLAITTDDCDLVLRTARTTGSRLYVGHNLRHAPFVRRMRQLVLDGAVGRVRAVWCRHFVGHGGDFYFKDWHAERRNTTSLLLQKGAHDLDVIHWLAGGSLRRVTAVGELAVYGGISDRRDRGGERMSEWHDPEANWPPTSLRGLNPVVDVEDISMLHGRTDNGVLVSYEQCHFTPDYWRNYTVIGDHGRLENFGDLDGSVIKVWNSRRSGYRDDADLTVPVPRAEGMHGGADRLLVEEFLRFAAAGGPTETSPLAAREAVAAGHAAATSLRSGSVPVEVPPLPEELVSYYAQGQP